MNHETNPVMSNNNVRRMQTWAREHHPADWEDRCSVIIQYLDQLPADDCEWLIKKGWPEVFSAAERDWPEAFDAWETDAEQIE